MKRSIDWHRHKCWGSTVAKSKVNTISSADVRSLASKGNAQICAHTLLAPSKFQTSGLAKCIGNGDMRRDDIISENIYSQDSQGNKNRLQRKAKANFGTRKHLLQLCSLQICQSSNRINDQLLLYLTVVSFLLNGPNSFQLLIAPLVADRCW